jgi:hypothetical protein
MPTLVDRSPLRSLLLDGQDAASPSIQGASDAAGFIETAPMSPKSARVFAAAAVVSATGLA